MLGIAIALIGLSCMIGGALASVAARVASTVDPDATGTTRAPVTFVTEERTYRIINIASRLGDRGSAAAYRCEVTRADGTTVSIDGSTQAVAVDVGKTETVGAFDAVAGTTVVECRTDGGLEGEFVVEADSPWDRYGTILLVAGSVVLIAGAGCILLGVFTRTPLRAS